MEMLLGYQGRKHRHTLSRYLPSKRLRNSTNFKPSGRTLGTTPKPWRRTMDSLQFVNVTYCKVGRSKKTPALGVSEEDRRRIRIQVQRDFRRKEKQRLSNAPSPQYTGSPSGSQSVKGNSGVSGELSTTVGPPSQIPSTIKSPDLWLDSLARSMTEDCYPRDHGGMHVLENNVAYSYSMKCDAPMLAIREALSCLHVGSTLRHESIINEGRRRYVCAINCLREDATSKKPRMTVSGLSMVGMGILLCQVNYFIHYDVHTHIDNVLA